MHSQLTHKVSSLEIPWYRFPAPPWIKPEVGIPYRWFLQPFIDYVHFQGDMIIFRWAQWETEGACLVPPELVERRWPNVSEKETRRWPSRCFAFQKSTMKRRDLAMNVIG